jgi:polyhydroxybutyrate depolymerase
VRVGTLERTYRLHLPVTYETSMPTPLVLSFHGHGSSAEVDERLTGLSHLADLHHFIAVYPQGVVGPDGLTGWNTGRAQDPVADDPLFVATLLTQLQGVLCVDPQRIYATGFSNGGGMTAVVACVLASRIAAFAPVAGDYYPPSGGCHPARPVPLLEIHGTLDSINPYGGSEQKGYPAVEAWLHTWAQRDGCVGGPSITANGGVVAQEWRDCQDGVVVLHYQLVGSGHVWPGAALSARRARLGTPDTDFDATAAIWSFVSAFALPGSGGGGAV